MDQNQIDALRYPIGKFTPKDPYTAQDFQSDINRLESFPDRLKQVVSSFSALDFNTPYRKEGWTVLQTIHHLADSHLHAYIRVKWALTEDNPSIKAYHEKLWAQTPENNLPAEVSLNLLSAHHKKWTALLRSLDDDSLAKSFVHPASGATVSIQRMVQLYAWHGDHHLAHITELVRRNFDR
ncbi:MAG: putative metal-dependent hydrolase [Bacteroidetes bacterium]|nr:putative metal-dependent hydrolase [Bacteroidota bacterium]